MEFIPKENSVGIRNPATANLLINSLDRVYAGKATVQAQSASDFTISKPQSLMNGYFTRIGVQEVQLNWGVYNISSNWNNNYFSIQSAASGVIQSTITIATVPEGNYSVAQGLNTLSSRLNAAFSTNTINISSFVSTTSGQVINGIGNPVYSNPQGKASLYFVSTNNTAVAANVFIPPSPLADQLNLDTSLTFAREYPVINPYLLPYNYIDIVSPQLTINQNVKDSSTSMYDQNILYRWIFAWPGGPPQQDGLGYPIQQGYIPFSERRNIAFPKQIKYEPNIPIGQLGFQVIAPLSPIAPPRPLPINPLSYVSTINPLTSSIIYVPGVVLGSQLEWQMTCLVSEN
jgi:hypothetical protein